MKLNKLSLKDKKIINQYLSFSRHGLSVYNFNNIYIWQGLFTIYWTLIQESLCIFFQDKIGCFLYLEPLARRANLQVIRESFKIMDRFNKNPAISRIENVELRNLPVYKKAGYRLEEKPGEYLCRRSALVNLRGNNFKSKRACFNYFVKNYRFQYLPFTLKYQDACFNLYQRWAKERQSKNQDRIYQGMLKDSQICLKGLLDAYKHLDLFGRLVKVDNEIKAFTFGFKLNPDTFCILYEIADLQIKGLAQFIFQRFCQELAGFKYVNIMDDSGLENLKQTKLSYHPFRLISAYIIQRSRDGSQLNLKLSP